MTGHPRVFKHIEIPNAFLLEKSGSPLRIHTSEDTNIRLEQREQCWNSRNGGAMGLDFSCTTSITGSVSDYTALSQSSLAFDAIRSIVDMQYNSLSAMCLCSIIPQTTATHVRGDLAANSSRLSDMIQELMTGRRISDVDKA